MADDVALLQRYSRTRDADAFAAVVKNYASLVYATCLRITGNPHDAEDVTQECFLHLARQADRVTSSVAGYLHALATSRSLNALRNAATRRQHEGQAVPSRLANAEPSWKELAPHVDAAIAALHDDLRLPLVAHYFEGRTQGDIAADLQVNQATVSRRLNAAIEELRVQLATTAHLGVAPILLTSLLRNLAPTFTPAPVSLVSALTKIALAGPAPSVAAGTTAFLTAHAKLVAIGVSLIVAALAAVITLEINTKGPTMASSIPAVSIAASVRHENKRVWIEGVPRLQWGKAGDNTFTGAFHASLAAMGDKTSYARLMVNSGLAFRLRWGRSVDGLSWNGSAPIGELSDVDLAPSTGWLLRWDGALNNHRDEGVQRIVASINAGRPVLGYVNRTEWDMGLIYGYENSGEKFLVQDYYYQGKELNIVPADDVHDLVAFFDQKKDPVSPHDALLQGLQKAITSWNMGTIDVQQIKPWESKGKNLFYYGPNAYRQWREDLAAADKLPTDKLAGLRQHNMWIGCSLSDGRHAAAESLSQMLPLLRQESARKELRSAADTYAQLADLCAKRLVPCLVTDIDQFTPELCQTAIAVLGEIEGLDTQAMAHLIAACDAESTITSDQLVTYDNTDPGLSHMYTVRAWLQHAGHTVDFDTLMAGAGEAFCYYYHPQSYPLKGQRNTQFVHSWNVANSALALYGYRGQWVSAWKDNDIDAGLTSLKQHLASGEPLVAAGIMPNIDGIHSRCDHWFLITGVDAAAQRITVVGAGPQPTVTPFPFGDAEPAGHHPCWYGILRTFADGIKGHYWPDADRPIFPITRVGQPLSAREIARTAFQFAASLAEEPPATTGRAKDTYMSGLAALEQLHSDLLATQGDGIEDFRHRNPLVEPSTGIREELAHMWLLAQRRRAAVRYMSSIAPLFPEAVRSKLTAASAAYGDSAAHALAGFELLYQSAAIFEGMPDDFPTGGHKSTPESVAYWQKVNTALAAPAVRKQIAEHLAQVIAAERVALGHIKAVLAASIPIRILDGIPPAEGPNGGNASQVADVTRETKSDPDGRYVLVSLANRPETPDWTAAKVLIEQYSSATLPESVSIEVYNPGVPIRIVADTTDARGQFEIAFCPNDTIWTGWKTFATSLSSMTPDRFNKNTTPFAAPLCLDYVLIIQRQGKPYRIGLRNLELHFPTTP